jgi:hypothetical protein
MTVVLAVLLAVAVGVILWLLRRNAPGPYLAGPGEKLQPRLCDLCDQPATSRVVATFDDPDEQAFRGGGTAMVADYCAAHTPEA